MGIEIIRLGAHHPPDPSFTQEGALSHLYFQEFFVPRPEMNVWMMYADNSRPLFPWWTYSGRVDEDMEILNQVWDVTSQQSFFDCLFLFTLQKVIGGRFYVIFPGIIKSQSWANVKPVDRSLYLSGQACVYHLLGSFDKKLSIQWVPFWQPQSLVKDPAFISLWRLFRQINVEDSGKSLTFFHLLDDQKLPRVLTLLNDAEENRSDHLSGLVDFFGMYSAPVHDIYKTGCIVYAKQKASLAPFTRLQQQFEPLFVSAQNAMGQRTDPRSALRFLSDHIAL